MDPISIEVAATASIKASSVVDGSNTIVSTSTSSSSSSSSNNPLPTTTFNVAVKSEYLVVFSHQLLLHHQQQQQQQPQQHQVAGQSSADGNAASVSSHTSDSSSGTAPKVAKTEDHHQQQQLQQHSLTGTTPFRSGTTTIPTPTTPPTSTATSSILPSVPAPLAPASVLGLKIGGQQNKNRGANDVGLHAGRGKYTKMCKFVVEGHEERCKYGKQKCNDSHDWEAFEAARPPDLGPMCHVWQQFHGVCPAGVNCRFSRSHTAENASRKAGGGGEVEGGAGGETTTSITTSHVQGFGFWARGSREGEASTSTPTTTAATTTNATSSTDSAIRLGPMSEECNFLRPDVAYHLRKQSYPFQIAPLCKQFHQRGGAGGGNSRGTAAAGGGAAEGSTGGGVGRGGGRLAAPKPDKEGQDVVNGGFTTTTTTTCSSSSVSSSKVVTWVPSKKLKQVAAATAAVAATKTTIAAATVATTTTASRVETHDEEQQQIPTLGADVGIPSSSSSSSTLTTTSNTNSNNNNNTAMNHDDDDANDAKTLQANLRTTVTRIGRMRTEEKRKIDFHRKVYVAPLTTVGNLPFRRVMKTLGADITCGEMALASNLVASQFSEWALLRRHASEDIFGVQIAGCHTDTVSRACELISDQCEVDFVDLNCGCPLDLVVNKGMGSGSMAKPGRLRDTVIAMDRALYCPVTVKMRTGLEKEKEARFAHKLISKMRLWNAAGPSFVPDVHDVRPEWVNGYDDYHYTWNNDNNTYDQDEHNKNKNNENDDEDKDLLPSPVAAVTVHGRTRHQRYNNDADWSYIRTCVDAAKSKDVTMLYTNLYAEGFNLTHPKTLVKCWGMNRPSVVRHLVAGGAGAGNSGGDVTSILEAIKQSASADIHDAEYFSNTTATTMTIGAKSTALNSFSLTLQPRSIPVIGNGDVMTLHDFDTHIETTGVTTCLLARGVLIKPWLCTEIKERRPDYDISSSERLDMLRQFVNYGLEHWGSDQGGVNHVRRFLLEWLSFLHRYVPVGILEHATTNPQRIGDRVPTFIGRNDLETLMGSPKASDWVKISELLLGPVPDDFMFIPKHKSSSSSATTPGGGGAAATGSSSGAGGGGGWAQQQQNRKRGAPSAAAEGYESGGENDFEGEG